MADYGGQVFLEDGPCAGAYTIQLAVPRYPAELRAACAPKRPPAVLDLPDDEPEGDEALHRYRDTGNAMFLCGRGTGPRGGHRIYRHAGLIQPPVGEQASLL